MFPEFASWLHKTPVSLALQHQVSWLWPTCETLHFAGLAMLLGVAGTYRQNDSVDVAYRRGGKPVVAAKLPLEPL